MTQLIDMQQRVAVCVEHCNSSYTTLYRALRSKLSYLCRKVYGNSLAVRKHSCLNVGEFVVPTCCSLHNIT